MHRLFPGRDIRKQSYCHLAEATKTDKGFAHWPGYVDDACLPISVDDYDKESFAHWPGYVDDACLPISVDDYDKESFAHWPGYVDDACLPISVDDYEKERERGGTRWSPRG